MNKERERVIIFWKMIFYLTNQKRKPLLKFRKVSGAGKIPQPKKTTHKRRFITHF